MLATRHFNPMRWLRKARWRQLAGVSPASLVTAHTWHGTLTFTTSDGVIGKHLFVDRAYERSWIEKAPHWLRRLGLHSPHRDTLVDAGAHVGMVTCSMLKHNYFRRAVAIEPAPGNFALLASNVAQNDLGTRVQLCRAALSDQVGRSRLAIYPMSTGCCRMLGADEGNHSDIIADVATTTLDAICAESGLAERIGLVWMDVEGHESKALAGAKIIRELKIPVVCELNVRAVDNAGAPRDSLLNLLKDYFGHFCMLDQRICQPRPITQIDAVYESQRKHDSGAVNLLLI